MYWSFDLNESDEVLAFQFGEHTISARHGNKPLTKDAFYGMVVDIKASVAGYSSSHFSLLYWFF